MPKFKDLTDACMSLLNNNRIDDVFINDGYVEVKALAHHENDGERVYNSKQLEKELKETLYLTKATQLDVEHVTTRKGYRFWNVSLKEA